MRWSMRVGIAAAAAVVLAGVFAAPANAVPGGGATPVALTQNATPDADTITANWGTYGASVGGGFSVADETTSLQVTLPAKLSGHFGDAWTYTLTSNGSSQPLASGAVPDASEAFTVAVPQSLHGFTELTLLVADGEQPSTGTLVIALYAMIHVKAELNSTVAPVALLKATASNWGHVVYPTAGPSGATVSPGSILTITSPPGTWTAGPDGDWTSPGQISGALTDDKGLLRLANFSGTASADGATLTIQIPSVSAYSYWPYFPDGSTSRPIVLSIGMLEKGVVDETLLGGEIFLKASLTLVPATKPALDRVDGGDRFDVAVAVSQQAFPDGAKTAFVVTGANYPDALSAGPAAVHRDAPLLLTLSDSLPPVVATELGRLKVDDVYVVGGPNSVSESVVKQIEKLGATVHRIGGADRFAASRALAADAFAVSGSGLVYIATGMNFPDALAAGGAAGHADGPVILVNGGAPTLDEDTRKQLVDLGVTQIKIAGGPASVSPGIEEGLKAIAPTKRLWGPDRITAAAAINLDAYGSSDRAFVVTGYKFSDALTGSAWAGRLGAPLYVSLPDCLPGAVADAIAKQGAGAVTLIGGPASLAPAVQDYDLCPVQ
jgi:putative cell wall-binding protein